MTSWATQYSFGGPNWAGNPPIATLSQLNSSIGYTSTVSNALSSTTGVVSNALQTEINTIVAGGTTSLWANYPAISNINMNGCNIYNCSTVIAKYLSTMDLQVSSINGADISIFNSTVTVAGVSINNGTVTTTNITNNPAKGGGGGGGNNPTAGGSGNSTWQMVNNTVGAVMDTVSKTQQAISGVLNNTGAVLFQTYYAVETAGAVIDLANGAVQLATNAQAMYDTREQNLIAGPGGPPGQTSYVYETISGTTQFQFSTLGAPVYSVFRTTDQVNPNQTFGREIFTSTIIPAGSKVVRSVSDPYQFPIISTIAISTTNYLQSFGQWHAILEPDYNLYASTLTANLISSGSAYVSSINANTASISSLNVSSIYGNLISSGSAYVSSINANSFSTATASISSLNANAVSTANANMSSINGISIYDLLNKTPSNLSANIISTSFLQVSTFQAQTAYISSLYASTLTVCNLIDNFYSTTTGTFDVINVSSLFGGTLVGDFLDVSGARISFKNLNSDSSDPAGVQIFTSNDNYYITTTIPQAYELSSYTNMTSWTNQTSNFITNPSYFPALPSGAVNITLNGGNYFLGSFVNEGTGQVLYTNNSGYYQLVTVKQGIGYIASPNGSYYFWTSNSAGFVIFFQDAAGNQQGEPAYVEANEYIGINYYGLGTPSFFYNTTSLIPAIAFASTATVNTTNLILDNFDTVLTTSNTYQKSGMNFGYAGNLALNYSTIAFGPSTVRGATIPYTFSGAIQAPQVSSMNVNVSSINGWAFSNILNPGFVYSTFSNIYLTPANGFGINMSTGTVGGSFEAISSFSSLILHATMNFTTTDQAFIPFTVPQMNITNSNINIWASTIISVTQPQVGTVSNVVNLGFVTGGTGQVDVCNTSGCNIFIKGGINGFMPNNSWRRFTYNGSFWAQNFSPSPQNASYDTALNVYQKWDGAYINTADYLYISTGGTQFDGDLYADNVYAGNLQITGEADFDSISTNSISTNVLGAGTINATSLTTTSITTQQITTSNMIYSTIFGRVGEAQIGIDELATYSNIGSRLTYTNGNQNHFAAFPFVSSLRNTTALQSKITYPTYPGSYFTLIPTFTGSNTYQLNNDGSITSAYNPTNFTWPSSIMNCYFASYPTGPFDLIKNPGTKGEVILVGTNNAPSAYFFQFNGTSAIQQFMTLGSIHKWTCTDGTNWTCNTSASLYPTNSYTDTMSLVQQPGGVLQINSQYISFGNNDVTTWTGSEDGTLIFIGGVFGRAINSNRPATWQGKSFSYSDYVMTMNITQARTDQPSLAINAMGVNTYIDGNSNWQYAIYMQTATISFEWSKNVTWHWQITMTPRSLSDGINTTGSWPNNPSVGYEDWHAVQMPEMLLSSIFASTLTFKADENISLNANLSTPTFLGFGNVALNAASNIDIMANYDVNIDAYDSVFVTGNSTITLTSYNPGVPPSYTVVADGDSFPPIGTVLTIINVLSYTVYQLYLADSVGGGPGTVIVSIPPGGTYSFTVANTIPNGGYQQVAAYDTGGNSVNQIIQNLSGVVSYYVFTSPPNPITVNTGIAGIPDSGLINLTASTITLANYVDISGALFAPSLFVSSIYAATGVQIRDTSTGGTGSLTVDSGNHLYWNGTLIA